MIVESVMSRKVVWVELDCPLADVLNKLRAYRISCVVVCEEGVPVGVISEHDIVGVAFNYVSGKGEERSVASELMSTSLTTVSEGASVDDAIATAEQHRIRHIPVVDAGGGLVGLVTQTDLLRASLQQLEELRSDD